MRFSLTLKQVIPSHSIKGQEAVVEVGGYFSTSGDDPSILIRMKEEYDSAEPTATSIAVSNLVRLSSILSSKSETWMENARKTIEFFAETNRPSSMPQLASSMYLYEAQPSSKKVRGRR